MADEPRARPAAELVDAVGGFGRNGPAVAAPEDVDDEWPIADAERAGGSFGAGAALRVGAAEVDAESGFGVGAGGGREKSESEDDEDVCGSIGGGASGARPAFFGKAAALVEGLNPPAFAMVLLVVALALVLAVAAVRSSLREALRLAGAEFEGRGTGGG